MLLKSESKFAIFFIIVALGTLLNVRYMTKIYKGRSNDAVQIITYHTISSTEPTNIPAFCPEEYNMNASVKRAYGKIQQKSLRTNSSQVYSSKVLILTPISNVGKNLADYFRLLCSLSYPHHLISIAVGEDSSKDKSLEVAKIYSQKLKHNFRRLEVHHFDDAMKGKPLHSRHDLEWQLKRRSHMAAARNRLLSIALKDEDWVLWIDADIKYAPPDLVQHLLSAAADVTAVSCMFHHAVDGLRIYDMNSWQETDESRAFLQEMGDRFLMLEGYGRTKRRMLPSVHDQGVVVDLDGVGGCALLINADNHRKGLVFPTFVFENHIETEGLAKLARKMDLSVKGLPYVFVVHS